MSQDFLNDKKAFLVSGLFDLGTIKGTFNEDRTEDLFLIDTESSASYFIYKGVFAGLGLNYQYDKTEDSSSNLFGIGPEIGYMFGHADSKLYPYIKIGYRNLNMKEETEITYSPYGYGGYSPYGYGYGYGNSNSSIYPYTSTKKYSGYGLNFGAGLIYPIRKHLGLTVAFNYWNIQMEDKNDNRMASDGLSLSIGFIGAFF